MGPTPFLLHPGNLAFVTAGRRRLASATPHAVGVFIAAFMFGIGALFVALLAKEWTRHARLNWQPVAIVEGRIESLREDNSGDSTSYLVAYSYAPEGSAGGLRKDERSVGRKYWRTLSVGQAIRIRHNRQHPETSRIEDSPRRGMAVLVIGSTILTFYMVGVCVACAQAVRPLRRIRQLERRGVVVPGVVVGASISKDSEGSETVKIRYSFVLGPGSVLYGVAEAQRPDLNIAKLPPAGTPVFVVTAGPFNHTIL